MANSIVQIFEFEGFKVRTVGTVDRPEWVAKDVCEVLGIQNTSDAIASLEDYQKGIATIYTLGGNQAMLTVTEPGLYELVIVSRKPQAKAFRRWVFEEVLPSIRKTGRYALSQDELSHEEALNQLKAIRAALAEYERSMPVGSLTVSQAAQCVKMTVERFKAMVTGFNALHIVELYPRITWNERVPCQNMEEVFKMAEHYDALMGQSSQLILPFRGSIVVDRNGN